MASCLLMLEGESKYSAKCEAPAEVASRDIRTPANISYYHLRASKHNPSLFKPLVCVELAVGKKAAGETL